MHMELESELKVKKRRRGKKSGRRSRGRSWSEDCGNGALDILTNVSSPNLIQEHGENKTLGITRVNFHSPYGENKQQIEGNRRYRARPIRPRYSPKAPHNSTQFIMDDHEYDFGNGLGLGQYPEISDEFYSCRDENLSKNSESDFLYKSPKCLYPTVGNDYATNSDTDLEIENIQIDNTFVFMTNDFENCYQNAKTEELSQLSRENLIDKILDMEKKVMELEKKLCNKVSNQNSNLKELACNVKQKSFRSYQLEQLQSLREENISLKLTNTENAAIN